MTSITLLDLPERVKDTLIQAELDTVEDLLLFTPPSTTETAHRFKRHQPSKGSYYNNTSNNSSTHSHSNSTSDRLTTLLTPDEIALAYDQASAYVFENRIAYGTALDLLQEENWLSMGDPILDQALGGQGFMTRGITEIAGESAVGKTQFCLQLCLTVQLPKEHGGLDGGAVWLSTEGKLPYSRLETMIQEFVQQRKQQDLLDLDADNIRENIFFDSMADQETQLHIINYQLPILIQNSHVENEDDFEVDLNAQQDADAEADPSLSSPPSDSRTLVSRFRKKPVKLIIIDSITNNFRSELKTDRPVSGAGHQQNGSDFRSSILQRGSDLCETGIRLRTLADHYGLTVICVNQVTDVFGPESTVPMPTPTRNMPFSSHDPLKSKKPALGLVWENTINARVFLHRTRVPETDGETASGSSSSGLEPQRTMSVIFAPWAPGIRPGDPSRTGECQYRIENSGVVGISEND